MLCLFFVMLSGIRLCVVMLRVVAPFKCLKVVNVASLSDHRNTLKLVSGIKKLSAT
jgi:hypothetical protein